MAQPYRAAFAQRLEDAQRVHARGDLANAIRLFSALNAEHPDHPAVLHALGVAFAQAGRLQDAEAPLLRTVRLLPHSADAKFDLAALRDAQGRSGEAEATLKEIVKDDPLHARAWASIGLLRKDAQDYATAAQAFQSALMADPTNVDHALAAAELLAPDEGATILSEMLQHQPQEDRLLLPLAELLIRAEQYEEAVQILQILRARTPQSSLVYRHLGATLNRLQRYAEAAAVLYDAIRLDPKDPESWVTLAVVRDAVGDPDGSGAAIARALDLCPEDLDLICRQALLQQNAARAEEGRAILRTLPTSVQAKADVRLLGGMLMPPIADSNAHIDAIRERWMETMADVEARPTPILEPWATVGLGGYNLGYHGREDRPLLEAFAKALLATSPHLGYVATDHSGSGQTKLRVGFLSAHMRRHSVGRVLIRLMGELDRDQFEVVLLQVPDKLGGGQELAERRADRTVRVPTEIGAARVAVEAEHLDVLIFCDLHLHPFTDALSFSRLAPVQATTWGHPGTGGRTSIDYWVSCEDWELTGNERLYTEKLVRLPLPPFVYDRPIPPHPMRERASFGLPDDARLYGSLQSLPKFHPDYDSILASILEADPKGRIVLIDGPQYTFQKALRARFARTFDANRVDFIPRIGNADYLSAVGVCDVMLDPIHFAGANTTLEAFALGKPVVTMRGDQMRNRATGGFYRQLGYEKLVADGAPKYVELALRLAQDRRFYREAKEAILGANDVLFDNLAPVRPFERWLLSVRK